jgi:hemoglobin
MASHTSPSHRSRDLDDDVEIAELVRRFYADVAQDDLLGPMFEQVARVDWSEHLPKLTAFWCRILLSQPGYEGNPFRAHVEVHERRAFTRAHFERWLELFHDHVDLGWAGPKAEQAKAFARRVAQVHSRQIIGEAVDHDPDHHRHEGGDPPCWAHLAADATDVAETRA